MIDLTDDDDAPVSAQAPAPAPARAPAPVSAPVDVRRKLSLRATGLPALGARRRLRPIAHSGSAPLLKRRDTRRDAERIGRRRLVRPVRRPQAPLAAVLLGRCRPFRKLSHRAIFDLASDSAPSQEVSCIRHASRSQEGSKRLELDQLEEPAAYPEAKVGTRPDSWLLIENNRKTIARTPNPR